MKISSETSREALYKEICTLSQEIQNWDKDDLYYLMRDIKQLNQLILDYNFCDWSENYPDTDKDHWIDLNEIPSEPVPDEVSGYPVWLVDKKGFALVGEAADEIEQLSEILEGY